MQEASAYIRRDKYLPFCAEGYELLLSSCTDFDYRSIYFVWLGEEPTQTPLELLALLLFELPLVFTLRKLVPLFAERSHQLFVDVELVTNSS